MDFVFKSIHSHTAKIPDTTGGSSNTCSETYTKLKIDETQTINFKHSSLSPPIIIVGTNKNLLNTFSNKNDIIKQKFDKVKEFVSNKIYANHIVEPYFALDNLLDQPEQSKQGDFSDIEALKRIIELVALNEPYMGEQQPLKWMRFEKALRS